jgi:hypothetical protein
MLNRARGYSFRHPMNGLSGRLVLITATATRSLGIGSLGLLAKTGVIEPQQRVVSLV